MPATGAGEIVVPPDHVRVVGRSRTGEASARHVRHQYVQANAPPTSLPLTERRHRVIVLGLVLLLLGLFLDISILWTIGIILLVIGVVLFALGAMGKAVGGRKHYF